MEASLWSRQMENGPAGFVFGFEKSGAGETGAKSVFHDCWGRHTPFSGIVRMKLWL